MKSLIYTFFPFIFFFSLINNNSEDGSLIITSTIKVNSNDKMKIIGVYKVKGEKNVHLFELIIEEKPSLVDVGGFTQEIKGEDLSNWQVPFDEKYLDEEGMEVIGDDYKKPQEDKSPTRMIFFLHFLDLKKPLKTPYGDFDIPKPIDLPERLVGKVNYENPD